MDGRPMEAMEASAVLTMPAQTKQLELKAMMRVMLAATTMRWAAEWELQRPQFDSQPTQMLKAELA